METIIPTIDLQPPFRPSTLLTKDGFVEYCRKHDVKLTIHDLEEFHRLGILFPAVKLELGIVPFRKIFAPFDGIKDWRFVYFEDVDRFETEAVEIAMYYSTESTFIYGDDWLRFHDPNLISYPAKTAYFKWEPRRHVDFTTSKEEADGGYELFYDRKQLIALQFIREYLRLESDFSHIPLKNNVKFMQEKIAELYRFLAFIIDVEIAWETTNADGVLQYQKMKNEFGEEGMKVEWDLYCSDTYMPGKRSKAEALLHKHKLEIQHLEWWQWRMSHFSIFSSDSLHRHLNEVTEAALQAEDCNRIIAFLNWVLSALDGKERTVKNVLQNDPRPRCSECHMPFEPKPNVKNQTTCGRDECVTDHKKRQKKAKRRQAALVRHS